MSARVPAMAAAHPAIVEAPPPDVIFEGFGDSSLDFRRRGFTREMVNVPDTLISEVDFAIWYRLKEAGTAIPFPQRDLHLRSVALELLPQGILPPCGGLDPLSRSVGARGGWTQHESRWLAPAEAQRRRLLDHRRPAQLVRVVSS